MKWFSLKMSRSCLLIGSSMSQLKGGQCSHNLSPGRSRTLCVPHPAEGGHPAGSCTETPCRPLPGAAQAHGCPLLPSPKTSGRLSALQPKGLLSPQLRLVSPWLSPGWFPPTLSHSSLTLPQGRLCASPPSPAPASFLAGSSPPVCPDSLGESPLLLWRGSPSTTPSFPGVLF